MSNAKRRILLKATLAGTAVGVAVGAGLLTPRSVLAAWPKSAFNAKTSDGAMKELYQGQTAKESADIQVKAPQIAENGAVVPVTIKTSLKDVESIVIIVEKNKRPLAADFKITSSARPIVATRIKVANSSKVTAIVKSGGKLYSAGKDVKVTIGGCGG
ncbi:MAG: thiosulfate oxidation carrier protein SoxY [Pseudomonadota bacterium]